jgi:hypothetical protein
MTGFKEIEIGGKKRPVKYGLNTLALLEERIRIHTLNPLELAREILSASVQLAIVEIGLQEGCRVTKSDEKFTREMIADWFDKEGIRKMRKFITLFNSAISDSSIIGLTDDEKKTLASLSNGLISGELPSGNSASSPPSSGT